VVYGGGGGAVHCNSFITFVLVSSSGYLVVMENHLTEAVEQGDISKVIQLLREGVDVNSQAGLNGETALIEAAVSGNVDILSILVSCPSLNVNLQDLSGHTALLAASCNGHAPFVSALLQHPDIDPDLGDDREVTPLLAALMAGHGHVVNVLLNVDTRVDINHADREGHTPIMLAASQGMSDIVRKLLTHSHINLMNVSKQGKSASQMAKERGHFKVAEMIESEMSLRNLRSSSGHRMKMEYANSAIEQRFSEIQI